MIEWGPWKITERPNSGMYIQLYTKDLSKENKFVVYEGTFLKMKQFESFSTPVMYPPVPTNGNYQILKWREGKWKLPPKEKIRKKELENG